MSVDERMVKCKHRSGIRQYIKDNPPKCDEAHGTIFRSGYHLYLDLFCMANLVQAQ